LHPCAAPDNTALSVICLNPCHNCRTADWTYMQSDIKEVNGIMNCHFNINLHQTVVMTKCRSLCVPNRSELSCEYNTLLYSIVTEHTNYLEHQFCRSSKILVHTFPNLSTHNHNTSEVEYDTAFSRTQYNATGT